ncbi:MAG TPA: CoA ester lyase [Candidatus Thermoplasmatota archaeon]|nr:CoA ester lyase [Candidatus Thermoplasmatota archaeon]
MTDVRRSVLFTPGDREDRMTKALGLGADTVCFDLEDAVAPANKEVARQSVVNVLRNAPRGGSERCVRINALQGDEWRRDIGVVMEAVPDALMVPKAEDATAIARLSQELLEEEARIGVRPGSTRFLLIFETARGVLRSLDIAQAAGQRLAGVLFGAEDLAADVGIVRTRESTEVLMARSHVALTAAAMRVPAVDQVYVDIKDAAGLEAEARVARTLGYAGKMAIHPEQLAPIHRAFTPTQPEVERALRLLAAADAAGGGAFAFEGRMIDAPLLLQAQRVVRTADRAGMLRQQG